MQIMITMEQILSVLQKLMLILKVTFSQEKEISKSGHGSLRVIYHTASTALAEGNTE